MDLSPDSLRGAQFTERFRGYDAAEVDAFLNDAADALEELVAEQSAPMATLAAESARLAIEEVRRDGAEAIEELHHRREELEASVAGLRRLLEDRRGGVLEELALLDAALAESTAALDSATGGEAATEADPESDTFLARLEQVVSGETVSEQVISGETVSEHVVSEEAVAEHVVSEEEGSGAG